MAGGTPANPATPVVLKVGIELAYPRIVSEPDLKRRLLQTLAASAAREGELHRLSGELPPADPDQWAAKDHVAHLAHWRRYAAQVLTAVRTGATAPDAADINTV